MTDAHRAVYELEYGDERRARLVARAIGQEVDEIDDDRSRTRLDREGPTLAVAVEAADLVALRAATNTWLSLAGVAERVVDSVASGENVDF